ncbi:SET and MYND domain-containing protein 4-like [Patiria miniata]|uniref:Protein-lysine N-methyltransferase SMYD4 n=1 Tax=Patiria miniata TaxID=46514 RepID=A0A914A4T0_PATMI|nr:SET and MYND domain-containing protein 4-like [Patiria miniata]
MATFDWEAILKSAYRDCCDGEAFSEFRGASSDADRVSWCSQFCIWSDDSVRQFIQRCVEASCTKTSSKSYELSRSWREEGNEWFKKRRYNEALLSYTKSVRTAPYDRDGASISDSQALATAFGNRSAALYHLNKYELAIQECDRAINHGYPKALLHKILQRKGQCLIKMGQSKTAATVLRQALLTLDEEANMRKEKKESLKSEIEKLLSDCSQSSVDGITTIPSKPSKPEELCEPSDELASASSSVGLRICKDRGRHLVADLPVSAGELLIKEMPYAVVLLPEYHSTHCHQCCRTTLNPVPCPVCTDVQYCSDQCMRSAWDSHHWLECGLWDGLMMFGTQAWLSLRLLLQAQSWQNAKRVADEACSQQTSSSASSKHLSADPQKSATEIGGGKVTPQESEVKREEGTSLNGHGKQHHVIDPQTSQTESVREESEPCSTENTSPHNSMQEHISEEPQNSTVDIVRDGEDEVKRNNRTSLPGCDQDGCYRSDYRAVYLLMPHTKNHSDQQLFNMTMTALLLSKCIQRKLLSSTRWMHHIQKASATALNLGCLKEGSKDRTECSKQSNCTNNFESEKKYDCHKPSHNQLDENFPSIVSETAALLLRHLQQLTCNSHAVTTIQTSEDLNSLSSMDKKLEPTNSRLGATNQTLNADTPVDTTVDKQHDKQREAVVDTTKQVRLATAIYPTASLLNHSCQPNVIASFDGAVLTMRATRDIQPGQEILHCYGPHAKHMSRDVRQRALQEQYFFTCTCHACTTAPADEIEMCDWSNSFACCKCSHPLVQREGKKKVGVCVNSKCRHTQSLRDMLKEKERASNLFKLSQHFLACKHVEECLGILHQCYNIQREILYKHHKALAETQDCLAQCYSHMGDFKTAGKYLQLSIETVEKQYGSESIELANELHKLAQVLFNGGEVQDALVIVDRANQLLGLHYGPNHTDVQELTEMKSCLMSL